MDDKQQGNTRPAQHGAMEEKGATEWIAASSVAVQAATNLYQAIKPKSPPPDKKDG